MTGNLKKANKESECIAASLEAYNLIARLSGEKDPQTCRCLINLAQVYTHFEKEEESRARYQ